jgi:hypothetical protein
MLETVQQPSPQNYGGYSNRMRSEFLEHSPPKIRTSIDFSQSLAGLRGGVSRFGKRNFEADALSQQPGSFPVLSGRLSPFSTHSAPAHLPYDFYSKIRCASPVGSLLQMRRLPKKQKGKIRGTIKVRILIVDCPQEIYPYAALNVERHIRLLRRNSPASELSRYVPDVDYKQKG